MLFQVFRSTAEGETGHAHGHPEYLEEVGDPNRRTQWVKQRQILTAIHGETHEYTDMYRYGKNSLEKKALKKLLIGLKHLQKQRSPRR